MCTYRPLHTLLALHSSIAFLGPTLSGFRLTLENSVVSCYYSEILCQEKAGADSCSLLFIFFPLFATLFARTFVLILTYSYTI